MLEENKYVIRFAIGVIIVLVAICVAIAFLFAPVRSATVLAPRCALADEAHLDYHPLTRDYIGKLIAQQLKDDGVADDAVPQGYELVHAARTVAIECLP